MFETNVTGTFLCSKYVIPYMERQGGGVIITLTGGGSAEKLGVLTYALSKQLCGQFARLSRRGGQGGQHRRDFDEPGRHNRHRRRTARGQGGRLSGRRRSSATASSWHATPRWR